MSDNEIIKALEHCASGCSSEACRGCPFDEKGVCTEKENALAIHALDLINRQKAEIERLQNIVHTDIAFVGGRGGKSERARQLVIVRMNEVRAEAIKEFAERLKGLLSLNIRVLNEDYLDIATDIDNLVKEMIGEQE